MNGSTDERDGSRGRSGAVTAESLQAECGACQGDETADLRCPKSQRPCGHHCNHVMTHDACDWCGQEWGEDADA